MISIVIPCFNVAETIRNTLDSLYMQSDPDYQIVIVDDGSSDGTLDLCERHAQNDSRVEVIHQGNRGLMGAWKQGVARSRGDYIAFCDADDYLDNDFIERINAIIDRFRPDLIVFGMISEYSNGDRVKTTNRLEEGYYNEADIREMILPVLLSNGDTQSELILKSRWSKVYKKDVLLSVMPYLDERVSLGEDQLTMFAAMSNVNSVVCMGDYCPYHYVRTPMSMIGRFDRNVFSKIDLLYQEMNNISERFSYSYPDQVLYDRFSVTLIYIKKYICRSSDGYRQTMEVISKVRDNADMCYCIEKCDISRFCVASRLFACLFIRRMFWCLYYLSRAFEKIRGRDV